MPGPDAEAHPEAPGDPRRAGRPGDGEPPGRPDPHDVVLVGLDGGTGRPGRSGRRPGTAGDPFDASAAARRPATRPAPVRPTTTEPRTGEPPPPDLGRAAADITHAP